MLNVSVIIPHAGGKEILRDCLNSLKESAGVGLETIIVSNGPVDDVDEELLSIIPDVQILRYECNLGFAGACNRGVEAAKNEFVFLLNNDAVVDPAAVRIIAERMDADDEAGACQPKILSMIKQGYFDYSSAAGGEMDVFGYPFARGRVFDTLEIDKGQYDMEAEVFWGAGAALMLRKSLYRKTGGLAESFFAHMEEIDLLWRLRLIGYKTMAIPQAVVWHRGAVTIKSGSFKKHYLNHRNSLAMLFRNYGTISLFRYMPIRMVLDWILTVYAILSGDFVRARAVFTAKCWFWISLPYLIRDRRQIQKMRTVPDKAIIRSLYSRSVVWQYFVKKKRSWKQLLSKK